MIAHLMLLQSHLEWCFKINLFWSETVGMVRPVRKMKAETVLCQPLEGEKTLFHITICRHI